MILIFISQAATKPPIPKWNSAKSNKKQNSRQKHRSAAGKTSERDHMPSKSSLRKSNSDGNIHLSVTDGEVSSVNSPLKKSVTFRQDVLTQDSGELVCGKTHDLLDNCEDSSDDVIDDATAAKRTLKSCLWTHPGVVIQNGLEMEEKDLQMEESSELAASNQVSKVGHVHRKTQSSRAKLLAKMKEIPFEEEPCACRTVTRPTAALLAESKNGRTGAKDTSSNKQKLLVCHRLHVTIIEYRLNLETSQYYAGVFDK